jgi:hypothetical protein
LVVALAQLVDALSDGTAVRAQAQEASQTNVADLDSNAPLLATASAGASFLTADARFTARRSAHTQAWLVPPRREQSLDIPTAKLDALGPPLAASYLDEDLPRLDLPRNDFADTGPGTLTVSMAGLDVDAVRSVAGGRAQWVAGEDERGRLLVEGRLSWLYEYLQTDAAATLFFMPGDQAIFAVQGLSYGSNWALVGAGLRFELVDGWSAFAGYDAQANGRQLFHIGSAGLRYTW